MFELKTATTVRLTNLTCRVEAAGNKKDVPAITLRLKMESVENEVLDLLSKTARQTLYAAVEGQETLPGVAPTTPILRSKDIKHWSPEELVLNGWKVMIEHGIDDASAIAMGKCKIDGFTADLYDGGHIDLEFRVSTSDIDSEGVILARFTNGQSAVQGQVGMANFPNPQGLRAAGGNAWQESFAAGVVLPRRLGEPLDGQRAQAMEAG